MTTPNGQHDLEPNGSSSQATSTVLALDGWGPVIVEPSINGANGSEPEPIMEPLTQVEAPTQLGRVRQMATGWQAQTLQLSIDPELIRIVAPVAALAIAIFAGLKLGSTYRWPTEQVAALSPTSSLALLRRRVALAIDPTLTPPKPQRRPVFDRIQSLIGLRLS